MKKTPATLAALAASVFSAAAGSSAPAVFASAAPTTPLRVDPISYTNAELLYAYTDWDGSGGNGDGAILGMEYGVMDHFYVAASGQYQEAGLINIWSVSGGLGGYVPLSENIHLAADGGVLWVNYDVDGDPLDGSVSNGRSDDDFGWYVRPHIRAKFGCFEVHAGAQYSDVSEFNGDEWAGFVDLYFEVAPGWDVTAGASYSNDRTTATGGARYRF